MAYDYLVVGAGLTGATIARVLTDAGHRVLVVERRPHIAGNIHDAIHESGIRFHSYGPHYFRTDSDVIWSFVQRFAKFYPYAAIVKTLVDGQLENWPVTQEYLQRHIGMDWRPVFQGTPGNFEEACLAMMPARVYEKFVRGYTHKQWGKNPRILDVSLAGRFSVRKEVDPRLVLHKYQGLPRNGYTTMIQSMLRGIEVRTGCDYLQSRETLHPRHRIFFTGPIDEYFDFELGCLEYRAQQRQNVYLSECRYYQSCVQVNNPSGGTHVPLRTLEWKYLLPGSERSCTQGTLITHEIPCTPTEPDQYEYPFPDKRNAQLYACYMERAQTLGHCVFCGRLGAYKYYDMDIAIGHALHCAEQELERVSCVAGSTQH